MTRLERLRAMRARLQLEVEELALINELRARLGFNAPLEMAFGEMPPMGIGEILETVSLVYGLQPEQVRRRDRHKEFVLPRQHAFLECVAQLRSNGKSHYSLCQIGRYFGDLDHSTVLHGARAAFERLQRGELDLVCCHYEDVHRRMARAA